MSCIDLDRSRFSRLGTGNQPRASKFEIGVESPPKNDTRSEKNNSDTNDSKHNLSASLSVIKPHLPCQNLTPEQPGSCTAPFRRNAKKSVRFS
jgi:hypothetical protein